jgi:hypothetical protein
MNCRLAFPINTIVGRRHGTIIVSRSMGIVMYHVASISAPDLCPNAARAIRRIRAWVKLFVRKLLTVGKWGQALAFVVAIW